jgi:flagellar biosynthesis/type III secretory pathway chaperone
MLEAILVRETGLHREMLAVAAEKRDGILAGDLEKLEKAVTAERRLVAGIEDEEKKRLAVMPLLKSGLGLEAPVEKLSDIIPLFPAPEREKMRGIRDRLVAAIEEVRIRNRHNSELLKTSLAHVDSFLHAIADAVRANANYSRGGKRSAGGPAIIDRSA